jgi:hypothetical protein
MGLFDGQIKKLGDTLSAKFRERAAQIDKELESLTDPGKSLILKLTKVNLIETANIIQSALNE